MRFSFAEMPAAFEVELKAAHAQRRNFLVEQFRMIGVNLAKKTERDMQSLGADPARAGHALLLASNIARDFFRQEYGSE